MSGGPVSHHDVQHITQDFIVGDLVSSETLVRRLTQARMGPHHGSRALPPVPTAGEPVTVECSVGADLSVQQVDLL